MNACINASCSFVTVCMYPTIRVSPHSQPRRKRIRKKFSENGEVVMVTEYRSLDGGNRHGHVVIKVR